MRLFAPLFVRSTPIGDAVRCYEHLPPDARMYPDGPNGFVEMTAPGMVCKVCGASSDGRGPLPSGEEKGDPDVA